MSLPIPNNREQVYLSKVITKDLENIPIPISRFEIYLKCLLDFDKENLPTPISKQELILYDYILGNECNVSASNKTEMFLKALSTVEVAGLPTPQSKIDVFLDYIIRNGCLEKYEYCPFQIRDYLNVKNTPKAPMKFKSMKGNTLVNLARAVNLTIDDKSPTTNNIPFNSVQGFQAGKKYTIICKFEGYKGTKPIKFRQRKYDTSWNYEFNTLIKDFSDGIKITVYTPTQDFKDVALYIDYVDEKDTSVSISDVIILEGDHTQNPPNGYIEGMKSFGDGANEIEVLSVCKNIHNEREYPLKGEMILSQITGDVEYSKGSYNYTTDFVPMFHKGIVTLSTKDRSTWKKIAYYTKDKKFIKSDFCTDEFLEFYSLPPSNAAFYRIGVNMGKVGLNYTFAQLEYGKISTSYAEYQGFSKAMPMYRNSNNELIPIPLLRGKWEGDRFLWGDEILLHEDGKLYYHKRYEFVLLTGLEKEWTLNGVSKFLEYKLTIPPTIDNRYNFINDRLPQNGIGASVEHNKIGIDSTHHGAIRIKPLEKDDMTLEEGLNWIKSNNISLVYQLDQEEVYPCELSEQLYSFDNETNIFINGGAVVGETVIEVGTKLGPIVDSIRQDVNRSTRAIEGLMSGGIQECAYQLYPEDFENVPNVVEGEKNA